MIKNYDPEHIRNVVIIGHNKTGKTTLCEAILYMAGSINQPGRVEDRNTQSDYTEEEKDRGISIYNSVLSLESEGTKINLIDAPGMSDFVGSVRSSLRVAESAIVLVDSVDGIEIETEKIWHYADEYHIPRVVFINKMDKEKADFYKIIDSLQDRFTTPVAAIEIPIGQGDNFRGVIDLVRMKAIYPDDKAAQVKILDIPSELQEIADEYRLKLAEAVAESDDSLIEKFLEEKPLSEEEVAKGLLDSIKNFRLIPIMCGSATKNIGVRTLLRMIIHELPSPKFKNTVSGHLPENNEEILERRSELSEPFCGFVFKTTQDQYSGKMSYIRARSGELHQGDELLNSITQEKEKINHIFFVNGKTLNETSALAAGDIGVLLKLESTSSGHTLCDPKKPIVLPKLRLPDCVYSLAIKADSANEEEKLHQYLIKATDEDPTLKLEYQKETGETILSGMGEFHLRLILESIAKKYKIKATTKLPEIAYRETIAKEAESRYKHKKQSGGHGQYGDVAIRIAPKGRSEGYEFFDEIVGGVIPKQYIPGVQKGVEEALLSGVLAGYPVQDVEVHLIDGSHHAVDSSEYSFKIAGTYAFKEAMKKASPTLLEPIMKVTVYAENEIIGDVLGDINGRRGKVLGMEDEKNEDESLKGIKTTRIQAYIPHAEMLSYAIDLKSKSSGRARFEMEFSHYETIQGKMAQDVIESRKKKLEETS